MKTILKKYYKKTIVILLLMFVGLFVFRLLFGNQTNSNEMMPALQNDVANFQLEEPLFSSRKNYASKKYQQVNGVTATNLDQKYEKIADIKSFTTEFEKSNNNFKSLASAWATLMMKTNSVRLRYYCPKAK